VGKEQWTVESGQRTANSGQRTANSGQWIMDKDIDMGMDMVMVTKLNTEHDPVDRYYDNST
jgi:hypothetical protein